MNISELKAKQKAYFMSGATRSHAFRMQSLEKLHQAMLKYEPLLTEALKTDLNRHPTETYMCEIGIMLDEIRYHKKHLAKWMKEKHMTN